MNNVERRTISIHSPHARGDGGRKTPRARPPNFNPLPSCEGRRLSIGRPSRGAYFNPLPSCEGRLTPVCRSISQRHFNPLPSCEGRHKTNATTAAACYISIHSPHARGDQINRGYSRGMLYFNPLPSCEGRLSVNDFFNRYANFNPLPSCEGRLCQGWYKIP